VKVARTTLSILDRPSRGGLSSIKWHTIFQASRVLSGNAQRRNSCEVSEGLRLRTGDRDPAVPVGRPVDGEFLIPKHFLDFLRLLRLCRAELSAQHRTDSATLAEIAGAPATEHALGPDPRLAGSDLGASVGQTLVCQGESRGSTEGESEPKQCPERLHASPELQDFLLECRRPQARHVQAHHDLRGLAAPPTGGRAGTPRSVATVTSPVRWTRFRSRWS